MKSDASFIGLKNFERLLADQFFRKAIQNTWLLWILNFIPQIGIALLISAWFTNARLKIRAIGIWRALFYLPNLLMPAAVASLFFSLFSFFGPMNQFLVRAGFLPEALQFLQNATITRGARATPPPHNSPPPPPRPNRPWAPPAPPAPTSRYACI